MRPNQTLAALTARLLLEVDNVLESERPRRGAHVQGDTTTIMTLALACFYRRIPVGHVEAGLRTGNLWSPFPEEANRTVAGRFSRWHFAPTEAIAPESARGRHPGCARSRSRGNTVIDALLRVADKNPRLGVEVEPGRRLVLVTAHRRENFGSPLREICRSLQTLAVRNPDVVLVYPVHPNPNVQAVAHSMLNGGQYRAVPPAGLRILRGGDEEVVHHHQRFRGGAGGSTRPRQAGARAERRDRASGSGEPRVS